MLALHLAAPAVVPLSPPVTLHQLLTGFQTDWLILPTYAIEVALIAWYLACVRRLEQRGRHWSGWKTASFVAGLVSVFLATGSGIASYDDSNFVMHVVQHLVLMNVAPIFLGLGAPITVALQSSKRPLQSRILRVLNSRPVSIVTFPVVAAALNYMTMIVYFLTPSTPPRSATHSCTTTPTCTFSWWGASTGGPSSGSTTRGGVCRSPPSSPTSRAGSR